MPENVRCVFDASNKGQSGCGLVYCEIRPFRLEAVKQPRKTPRDFSLLAHAPLAINRKSVR